MSSVHRRQTFASTLVAAAVCLISLAASATQAQAIVTIILARVGNPGNKADSTVMVTDTTSGYGSVSYAYSIGVRDVTLTQYAAFLNAVAKTDTYGLYNASLGSGDHIKGIARSGTSGAYAYSVVGNGQNPVTYVTWLDAARFCNWLQNGQPATGKETAGTTETGAYTLSANTGLETKNAGAVWWIPTENEWYKAAYYDPTKGGTGGYWTYPTRSNAIPGNDYKTPAVANQANFINANGLFSVTQNATESGTQNYLTPVGSFTKSPSYYGTYDQGGDVYQWNDAIIGKARGTRGGSWDLGSSYMLSNARDSRAPSGANPGVGFRVASSRLPVPIITSALKATGTDGADFSYHIGASNAQSFSVSGVLPAGLAWAASTGIISGTPSQTGTFSPVIKGINASGTGSATLTLVVAAKPVAGTAAGTAGNNEIGSEGGTITLNTGPGEGGVTVLAGTVSISGSPILSMEPESAGAVAATYGGFASDGEANVGLVTLSLASNGFFTGKLALSGTSYPVGGAFYSGGTSNSVFCTNQVTLSLGLTRSASGIAGAISAVTATGSTTYGVTASQLATAAPSGLVGAYTASLPASSGTATSGSATIIVAATGAIQVAGALADGTPFTAGSQLNADGKTWSLFIPLYAPADPGSIAGTMTFDPASGHCSGTVEWIKPAEGADPGFSSSFQLDAVKAQ